MKAVIWITGIWITVMIIYLGNKLELNLLFTSLGCFFTGFWTSFFALNTNYREGKMSVSELTPEEQELYWQDMAIYGTAAIYQSNDGSVKYVPRNEIFKQKEK